MKKRSLLTALLVVVAATMFAADGIRIEPFVISPGGTLDVEVLLDNETDYGGVQFELWLPEGITIEEDEEELMYDITTRPTYGKKNTPFSHRVTKQTGGYYLILIYNDQQKNFAGESGTAIMTVSLVAASDITPGVKTVSIKGQELSTVEAVKTNPADVNYSCIVPGTETLDGVTVTTSDAGAVTVAVTDGEDVAMIPTTVKEAGLTYARTLTVGASDEMYTVCLPYTPPTDENLKYYTLSTVSGTTLTFDEVTTPEAYKPYLVVASATSSVGTTAAQSVDLSTGITGTTETGGEYELCGTLYGMTNAEAAAGGNIYILQDAGKWGLVTNTEAGAAADIPPFRAYIVKKSVGGSARLHSVVGNATGIKPISVSSEGESKGVWYTLGGLELTGEPTQKGAYVKDGRVIIK